MVAPAGHDEEHLEDDNEGTFEGGNAVITDLVGLLCALGADCEIEDLFSERFVGGEGQEEEEEEEGKWCMSSDDDDEDDDEKDEEEAKEGAEKEYDSAPPP